MTSLKAMQKIKGGTVESAASNCYGNWNFANKYFSIACFSNKLTYFFPIILSPSCFLILPSIQIIPWNERKSTPFSVFLLPPSPHTPNKIKSGNALFVHTLRQEVSLLYIRNSVPSWVPSYHAFGRYGKSETSPKILPVKAIKFCESPDFSKLPFPSVHKGNAALNYRKCGQDLGHLYS